MDKIPDNRAWWLVLPVFLLVAFSALIPLMTVVNYSVQDIFGPGQAYYVGTEWFKEVLADERLQDSLIRQFVFSGFVLLIQIPLGIGVALMMPKSGIKGSLCLILIAIPLLIPWNVVGTIWQIFARGDIGLFGWGINQLGIDYNYTGDTLDAWLTVLLMDVWHWTPLVALLCYSRSACHSRGLLSGGGNRPRFEMGGIPVYPAPASEKCADYCCAVAIHG